MSGSASHEWVLGEKIGYCDEWSLSDVEAFIPEPTLLEYETGRAQCVFDSKAHVSSGSGSATVELRVWVHAGPDNYERLAASGKVTDRFAGPEGDAIQADGVYMLMAAGNTFYVSSTRGDDWDDAREATAREIVLKHAKRYLELV
ncbi:hypothetical protein [Nocardioides sp. AE5]|uniref:hypothetical protein n=1 Tax=Nocardioides sp. AE5 TaxID=2962573 RepID=UPI002880D914|nr:hypothetical protein [Nocardioides sp. AE5]MDT0203035.1 hypothetical protein [Nocardioides sp. AE5]